MSSSATTSLSTTITSTITTTNIEAHLSCSSIGGYEFLHVPDGASSCRSHQHRLAAIIGFCTNFTTNLQCQYIDEFSATYFKAEDQHSCNTTARHLNYVIAQYTIANSLNRQDLPEPSNPTVGCTPNGFLVVRNSCSHTVSALNTIIHLYQRKEFYDCENTTPSTTHTSTASTSLTSTASSTFTSSISTSITTTDTTTETTAVRGKIQCALFDGLDYLSVNPAEGDCLQQSLYLNAILNTCDDDQETDYSFLDCEHRAGVNSHFLFVNGEVESCTHVSNLINTMLGGFYFPEPAPFTVVCSVDGYLKAIRGENCAALADTLTKVIDDFLVGEFSTCRKTTPSTTITSTLSSTVTSSQSSSQTTTGTSSASTSASTTQTSTLVYRGAASTASISVSFTFVVPYPRSADELTLIIGQFSSQLESYLNNREELVASTATVLIDGSGNNRKRKQEDVSLKVIMELTYLNYQQAVQARDAEKRSTQFLSITAPFSIGTSTIYTSNISGSLAGWYSYFDVNDEPTAYALINTSSVNSVALAQPTQIALPAGSVIVVVQPSNLRYRSWTILNGIMESVTGNSLSPITYQDGDVAASSIVRDDVGYDTQASPNKAIRAFMWMCIVVIILCCFFGLWWCLEHKSMMRIKIGPTTSARMSLASSKNGLTRGAQALSATMKPRASLKTPFGPPQFFNTFDPFVDDTHMKQPLRMKSKPHVVNPPRESDLEQEMHKMSPSKGRVPSQNNSSKTRNILDWFYSHRSSKKIHPTSQNLTRSSISVAAQSISALKNAAPPPPPRSSLFGVRNFGTVMDRRRSASREDPFLQKDTPLQTEHHKVQLSKHDSVGVGSSTEVSTRESPLANFQSFPSSTYKMPDQKARGEQSPTSSIPFTALPKPTLGDSKKLQNTVSPRSSTSISPPTKPPRSLPRPRLIPNIDSKSPEPSQKQYTRPTLPTSVAGLRSTKNAAFPPRGIDASESTRGRSMPKRPTISSRIPGLPPPTLSNLSSPRPPSFDVTAKMTTGFQMPSRPVLDAKTPFKPAQRESSQWVTDLTLDRESTDNLRQTLNDRDPK